jgi:hypothetical protein
MIGPRRLLPALLLPALLALGAPAPARASAEEVLRDCTLDGQLDRQHSLGELRRARRILPSDQDEYSACRDVIDEAILTARRAPDATSGSGSGAGGSGGVGASTLEPPTSGGSSLPEPPLTPPGPPPAPAAKAVTAPEDRAAVARATGQAPPALAAAEEPTAADGRRAAAQAARELPGALVLVLLALLALGGALAVAPLRGPLGRARVALRRG